MNIDIARLESEDNVKDRMDYTEALVKATRTDAALVKEALALLQNPSSSNNLRGSLLYILAKGGRKEALPAMYELSDTHLKPFFGKWYGRMDAAEAILELSNHADIKEELYKHVIDHPEHRQNEVIAAILYRFEGDTEKVSKRLKEAKKQQLDTLIKKVKDFDKK